MKILGLTGSIAMGKSTIADMFRRQGLPVHDADAIAHNVIEPGGTGFFAIQAEFPECIVAGRVDRGLLGAIVFNDADKRQQLEAIIHPLVKTDRINWLQKQRKSGAGLVVFDIPLLYESGADGECDAVAVAHAPAWLQRRRALHRPNMTQAKLDAILARQMDNGAKYRRADFIIPTHYGKMVSRWYVRRIIKAMI